MMMEEYWPRGELQKLEQKLWNLTMAGFEIVAYTKRLSDLAALFPRMVAPESKKIERYIWGLSPQIQGNVLASNPIAFDSAKCLTQRLIDYGVRQGVMAPVPGPTKRGDYNQKS